MGIFLQAVGVFTLMFLLYLAFEFVRNGVFAEYFSKSPIWQAIRDYKKNPQDWTKTSIDYAPAIKHKSGFMFFKGWEHTTGTFTATTADPIDPAVIAMNKKQTKAVNHYFSLMASQTAYRLARQAIEQSLEAEKKAAKATKADEKAIKKIDTAGTF